MLRICWKDALIPVLIQWSFPENQSDLFNWCIEACHSLIFPEHGVQTSVFFESPLLLFTGAQIKPKLVYPLGSLKTWSPLSSTSPCPIFPHHQAPAMLTTPAWGYSPWRHSLLELSSSGPCMSVPFWLYRKLFPPQKAAAVGTLGLTCSYLVFSRLLLTQLLPPTARMRVEDLVMPRCRAHRRHEHSIDWSNEYQQRDSSVEWDGVWVAHQNQPGQIFPVFLFFSYSWLSSLILLSIAV